MANQQNCVFRTISILKTEYLQMSKNKGFTLLLGPAAVEKWKKQMGEAGDIQTTEAKFQTPDWTFGVRALSMG